MKKYGTMLMALFIMLTAMGCQGQTKPPAKEAKPVEQIQLTVSAAASLQEAVKEISDVYMADHPNIKIDLNFASSGTLQKQIEEGAPVDVFISAAAKQMNVLEEKGLIKEGTRKDLLQNTLVLAVPKGMEKPADLKNLASDPWSKIALGEPDVVPAGTYAKEALTHEKLYTVLEPKMVFGKSVKEVLAWVETGNAEAGFIYKTDAVTSEQVDVALEINTDLHKPIIYPCAVLKDAKAPDEAEAFLTFLNTEPAQAVFEKVGYTVLP